MATKKAKKKSAKKTPKKKAAKPKARSKSKAKARSKSKAKKSSLTGKPKKLKVIREVRPKKLEPGVNKIREKLLQNRAELMKILQSSQAIERDVGELSFSNEIDLASSLEGREMMFQLSSRDRNEIKMLEKALFKIDRGLYGICESCAKKISMKRLQILPLSTLCIECQESLER
ncbi:MAG: TraR/DksA family transcriptional regulator [Nitrospinota bacterium]|nr:TraR/DksA family transcriptional regulator [Nitrospinota bacterium]